MHLRIRLLVPVAIAATLLVGFAPNSPVATVSAATPSEAQQIITIARAQVGDRYQWGAMGPNAFDCSGLVIYAYRAAGDRRAIRDGTLRTARSMYLYFKSRGLASRSNPRLGDLVVWGSGSHIGIYVGAGKAISALTNGVRVHYISAFSSPFTAYLHTGMSTRYSNA
jgi:cell wall-associated NlpC family hydrolase